MRIDEENPLFSEFNNKWQSLANEINEKLTEAEEQDKKNGFRGRDGKSSEITKEYSKTFTKLQKEYSFLYKDE